MILSLCERDNRTPLGRPRQSDNCDNLLALKRYTAFWNQWPPIPSVLSVSFNFVYFIYLFVCLSIFCLLKEIAKPQDVVYGYLCPSHFYDVFNRCLQVDPDKRPSFSEVRRSLIAQVRLLVNIERVYLFLIETTNHEQGFSHLSPLQRNDRPREVQGICVLVLLLNTERQEYEFPLKIEMTFCHFLEKVFKKCDLKSEAL